MFSNHALTDVNCGSNDSTLITSFSCLPWTLLHKKRNVSSPAFVFDSDKGSTTLCQVIFFNSLRLRNFKFWQSIMCTYMLSRRLLRNHKYVLFLSFTQWTNGADYIPLNLTTASSTSQPITVERVPWYQLLIGWNGRRSPKIPPLESP